MSDLRDLLEVAAGPVNRGFDYAAIVRRARQRRRNTMAAGGAVLAAALFLGALPWLNRSSALDLETRPDVTPADERVGTGPEPAGTGGSEESGAPADVPGPREEGAAPAELPPPGAPALAPLDTGEAMPVIAGRMAFTRSGDVWVADLDLTDQDIVATAAHSPAWSPDGSKLVFVLRAPEDGPDSERRLGTGHLAIADADSGAVTVIRDDGSNRGGWSVDSPAWSPDGSRIAFVQRYCSRGVDTTHVGLSGTSRDDLCRPDTPEEQDGGATSWSEIRSVRVDGTDERVVASSPDTYSESPSFSPDGERIVFARAANVVAAAVSDLYVASADGSAARNITAGLGDGAASSYEPSWSPDGRWIAFTLSAAGEAIPCGGRTSISLISPDGADHATVTDGSQACDSEAAWHPGASALLFTRRLDRNRAAGQLYYASPPRSGGAQVHLGPGVEAAVRPPPPQQG